MTSIYIDLIIYTHGEQLFNIQPNCELKYKIVKLNETCMPVRVRSYSK